MAELQAVTINVSNMDYTIHADIDRKLLSDAVAKLNEYIQKYKENTGGEELRAIVLAAVSIAMEQATEKQHLEELEQELQEIHHWAEKFGSHLDSEIAEL